MKRTLAALILAIFPLALVAQTASTDTAPPEARKRIIKVVHVHGDASVLANLAAEGSGTFYQASNPLSLIVLKGPAPDVAAVEHTIEQLESGFGDPTSKNVDLMVYVLAGLTDPTPNSAEPEVASLDPVLKQLRAVFPYKHYELINTVLLRSGQGSPASTTGMLRKVPNAAAANGPSPYDIRVKSVSVSAQGPPMVHVSKFVFEAHIPIVWKTGSGTGVSQVTVSTNTDLDLRPGEKVVVANSNVEDAGISLFLVLSAQLVD